MHRIHRTAINYIYCHTLFIQCYLHSTWHTHTQVNTFVFVSRLLVRLVPDNVEVIWPTTSTLRLLLFYYRHIQMATECLRPDAILVCRSEIFQSIYAKYVYNVRLLLLYFIFMASNIGTARPNYWLYVVAFAYRSPAEDHRYYRCQY